MRLKFEKRKKKFSKENEREWMFRQRKDNFPKESERKRADVYHFFSFLPCLIMCSIISLFVLKQGFVRSRLDRSEASDITLPTKEKKRKYQLKRKRREQEREREREAKVHDC